MQNIYRKMLAVLVAAIFFTFFLPLQMFMVSAAENEVQEPDDLFALSAVLMDGRSGRILYEKEGREPRANASTTKVLTCILAIENAPGDDYVLVSENAAKQPEVKLGLQPGEQYYLEDLLYSLMLKSHNDTAVAIAEHIGGSVEGFAEMMNQKAREIGCRDTYFITPNGLDEEDEQGSHHTTAEDLAVIMRYAIQNKIFLHITQTRDYSFSEITEKRSFSIHNANALLDMTDGILSGKTGFTAKAGYCYVCAWEKNGKCFIISLLACGWPEHKNYKWKDTMKLLKYGNENYENQVIENPKKFPMTLVRKAAEESGFEKNIYVKNILRQRRKETVLLRKDEKLECRIDTADFLTAPVSRNQKTGSICWYINQQKWKEFPLYADRDVQRISYRWCLKKLFIAYFS